MGFILLSNRFRHFKLERRDRILRLLYVFLTFHGSILKHSKRLEEFFARFWYLDSTVRGQYEVFLWEDLEWNFHGIEAGRCATIFSASKNQFHCFFAGLLTRKAAVARAGGSAGNWNVARINFTRPSSSSFAQFADRPAGRPLLGTTASCRSVNFTLDDRTMTVPFEIYHKSLLFP